MPDVVVRQVDFGSAQDMRDYVGMLDAYARDPMGADAPLSPDACARLRNDLPKNAAALGLLAFGRGQPVGVATCFVGYSTFRARPLLNIHDLAVLPAWRGRAVADVLLDAIHRHATRLGCCRITLEVREDNERARRVYARSGFLPGRCSLFLEKTLPL